LALMTIGLAVPSNAASAVTTSTNVLYAGHGVGIVATDDLNTGCSDVFLSSDMIKWRNIAPPLKNPADIQKGACAYVWNGAYFVSPSDGWLLARNEGSTDTILRYTSTGEERGSVNLAATPAATVGRSPSASPAPRWAGANSLALAQFVGIPLSGR
jgi:hypothetical protein